MIDILRLAEVLNRARNAAVEYYELTGKPLGITGEIGEFTAAQLLGLELADARTAGYDATDREGRHIQIKSRCIPTGKAKGGQRLGAIRLDHAWDVVMLVLLDERFNPTAIHEAERAPIEAALRKPGSRARNERGALAVSDFIRIGREVWKSS